MPEPTDPVETVERRAVSLGASADIGEDGERQLIDAAGGNREVLEAARNRIAQRMHGRPGDTAAGAALGLCNRSLVRIGWVDPFDWRGRLGNRLRKP